MRVVHVVDVAGALPIDLMDRPHAFGVALVGVRFADLVAQLVLEGREDGGEIGEALGWLLGLGIPAVGRHGFIFCYGVKGRRGVQLSPLLRLLAIGYCCGCGY